MPESLRNLEAKWVPEIRHSIPKAPFLIIGTQIDLREDEATIMKLAKRKMRPVMPEEGDRMAKKLGADLYTECSSLTRVGLKDVFDEAMLAVLEPKQTKPEKKKGKRGCVIL